MDEYTPDLWVIVDTGKCKKVFASWHGGYVSGASWKFSSGTKEIIDNGTHWTLPQESGSVYNLVKDSEGTGGWTSGVLGRILEQYPVMKVVTITNGEFTEVLNEIAKD